VTSSPGDHTTSLPIIHVSWGAGHCGWVGYE
jgi:hypothetical protein